MDLTNATYTHSLITLFVLAMPAIAAGVIHMAVVKFDYFPKLKLPLDAGLSWRGKRVFGDHKTLRGVLAMVVLSILFCYIIQWLTDHFDHWEKYNLLEFNRYSAIFYGLVYGLGYTLAELPNSFLKRRFNVRPGERGALYNVILDQVDSTLGCFLLLYPFISIQLYMVFLGVVFLSFIHLLINLILYSLNLRKQPL